MQFLLRHFECFHGVLVVEARSPCCSRCALPHAVAWAAHGLAAPGRARRAARGPRAARALRRPRRHAPGPAVTEMACGAGSPIGYPDGGAEEAFAGGISFFQTECINFFAVARDSFQLSPGDGSSRISHTYSCALLLPRRRRGSAAFLEPTDGDASRCAVGAAW